MLLIPVGFHPPSLGATSTLPTVSLGPVLQNAGAIDFTILVSQPSATLITVNLQVSGANISPSFGNPFTIPPGTTSIFARVFKSGCAGSTVSLTIQSVGGGGQLGSPGTASTTCN